jgi:ketosteroid isomerase-like protein
MPDHAALIHAFYEAFARRDADAMIAVYHPDVTFCDPAFGELDAVRVRGMWRMLCERGKDLQLEHSGVAAEGDEGRAHWEARYTFAATGRKVHNVIDATFRFADGKILRHVDVFDFWRWSRQALGLPGTLLGWTPMIRTKVRATANAQLTAWLAKRGG